MSESVLSRLHQEHVEYINESFKLAVARGEGGGEATEIRRRFAALTSGLLQHFTDEEESFFPWLLKNLPHEEPVVRALALQHVEMMRILLELRHALGGSEARIDDHAVEVAKRFVRLLDVHTEREQQLVREIRAT